MRLRMWGVAAGLGLALAGGAGAERYLVSATAGGDGDGHTNNDDPDAFAEFVRQDVGQERYIASANAGSGSLFASASRADPLPFATISTTAGASIEETIHFTELPPNPTDTVSITATLGVAVSATATVGFAKANGSVTLLGPGGSCTASTSTQSGTNESCQANAGFSEPGSVTLVVTRDQLVASGGEVDIIANVSAQLESSGGINGSASASGGTGFSRGGEPEPGTIHIDIDPPLAHTYTGSQTLFPAARARRTAPLAVGAATLAVARSRPAERRRA